ncbi:hypothetical protein GcM3_129016 [Golovinomyces cichoracearum]|uniref:Secreted effector protein n=1 Tax=Golovinomyces cichoracearum TaxID=62708 RepID=A0A420I584_9PEZI|nr:hypothetical protein GcM3_129016 [Golovinomyces cichoracearum]
MFLKASLTVWALLAAEITLSLSASIGRLANREVVDDINDNGIMIELASCKGRHYDKEVIYETLKQACETKNSSTIFEKAVNLRPHIPSSSEKYHHEINPPYYAYSLHDTVFKDKLHPIDVIVMNDECKLAGVLMETTKISCNDDTCGSEPRYKDCEIRLSKTAPTETTPVEQLS